MPYLIKSGTSPRMKYCNTKDMIVSHVPTMTTAPACSYFMARVIAVCEKKADIANPIKRSHSFLMCGTSNLFTASEQMQEKMVPQNPNVRVTTDTLTSLKYRSKHIEMVAANIASDAKIVPIFKLNKQNTELVINHVQLDLLIVRADCPLVYAIKGT